MSRRRAVRPWVFIGASLLTLLAVLDPRVPFVLGVVRVVLRTLLGGAAPGVPLFALWLGALSALRLPDRALRPRAVGAALATASVAGLTQLPLTHPFLQAWQGQGGGMVGALCDWVFGRVIGIGGTRVLWVLTGLLSIIPLFLPLSPRRRSRRTPRTRRGTQVVQRTAVPRAEGGQVVPQRWSTSWEAACRLPGQAVRPDQDRQVVREEPSAGGWRRSPLPPQPRGHLGDPLVDTPHPPSWRTHPAASVESAAPGPARLASLRGPAAGVRVRMWDGLRTWPVADSGTGALGERTAGGPAPRRAHAGLTSSAWQRGSVPDAGATGGARGSTPGAAAGSWDGLGDRAVSRPDAQAAGGALRGERAPTSAAAPGSGDGPGDRAVPEADAQAAGDALWGERAPTAGAAPGSEDGPVRVAVPVADASTGAAAAGSEGAPAAPAAPESGDRLGSVAESGADARAAGDAVGGRRVPPGSTAPGSTDGRAVPRHAPGWEDGTLSRGGPSVPRPALIWEDELWPRNALPRASAPSHEDAAFPEASRTVSVGGMDEDAGAPPGGRSVARPALVWDDGLGDGGAAGDEDQAPPRGAGSPPTSDAVLGDPVGVGLAGIADAPVPLPLASVPSGWPVPADSSGHAVSPATPRPPSPAYEAPPLHLLRRKPNPAPRSQETDTKEREAQLDAALKSFGVTARIVGAVQGPSITRFEIEPGAGVKVARIAGLAEDLALALKATDVRIAPVPGKSAVGIEVPNTDVSPVFLREVMESEAFRAAPSPLTVCLGQDIAGKPVVANLEQLLHVLVAGATGSGKSITINSMLVSLLYKTGPDQVRLVLVDPKMVELSQYNGIPHLLAPVVTNPRKAAATLQAVVREMERRYTLFTHAGVRNLNGYNAVAWERGGPPLPYVVIVIDELADLMLVARAEVEGAVQRLTQMARAAGIYLIVATQRPSVDVITGVIKANIPTRIALAVSSHIDSRTIIDVAGAEKLVGRGDMLFRPVGAQKMLRAQGAFVSESEVESVIDFLKQRGAPEYQVDIMEAEPDGDRSTSGPDGNEDDELFVDALQIVLESGQASVSNLQRRLRVGFTRAGRLIDMMEHRGFVGPHQGSRTREVLITAELFQSLYGPSGDGT